MTNLTIVHPDDGFHEDLRRLTRQAGRCWFSTRPTRSSAAQRARRALGPCPDVVTLGKSIGGGIPVGAYGMTDELAERFETHEGEPGLGRFRPAGYWRYSLRQPRPPWPHAGPRWEVLTVEAYERTASLGARLADGIEFATGGAGLDWRAHRLYAKSGYWFGPELPRNAARSEPTTTSSFAHSSGSRSPTGGSGVWASGSPGCPRSPWTGQGGPPRRDSLARSCSSSPPNG